MSFNYLDYTYIHVYTHEHYNANILHNITLREHATLTDTHTNQHNMASYIKSAKYPSVADDTHKTTEAFSFVNTMYSYMYTCI